MIQFFKSQIEKGYRFDVTDIWIRYGYRIQENVKTGECRVLDPMERELMTGTREQCCSYANKIVSHNVMENAVVMIHGMGHHRGVMDDMTSYFEKNRFSVANFCYASLQNGITEHAQALNSVAVHLSQAGAKNISFIGHSLGGLIARMACRQASRNLWKPHRLVLIGSPSQGSQVAKALDVLPVRLLAGPAWEALQKNNTLMIPIPNCSGIGVIAGGNGKEGFNPLLQGDNDGVVSVEETRLPGRESDFLLVNNLHSNLPRNPMVIQSSLNFIRNGRFK